jgi:hypothetical protein
MEILQTKSILAKLMATENLHVEQRNVATASFDVENRILTIPVLDKNVSNDEYDLFVGHEVGHALWTSYFDLKTAMENNFSMSVLNVIEDSRIERKIKAKYPGLRHSFIKGYRALMEKDFFEVKYKDVNTLPFMDRLNLHCKGGVEMGIRFTDAEMKLVDEVESTQTWSDVLEVYKKLMSYSKQEESQNRQKQKIKIKAEDLEDLEVSGEPASGEDADIEIELDSDVSAQSAGASEDESTGEKEESDKEKPARDGVDGEEEGEKGSEAEESKGSGGGGNPEEEISDQEITAKTNEALDRNQQKLFSKERKIYHYANLPTFDLNKIVVQHDTLWDRYFTDFNREMNNSNMPDRKAYYLKNYAQKYQDFRKSSKTIVSYLVKEFELRKNADQLKRASVAKTGELNMNKVYSYKFSEDIFKRITVMPGGKSHGLVMFIDWSGSMSSMMSETIEQLLNLVMFCKKVNIPYEVYAFSSEYSERNVAYNPGEMEYTGFSLLNLLSSRMTAQQFSEAAGVLLNYRTPGIYGSMYYPSWFKLGGTPLNEAAIAAMTLIPQFKSQYKLQNVNAVFLTDGDGNRVSSYRTPAGQRISPSGDSVVVIRDKKTGHEERFDCNDYASALTSAYIKLLKYRTKCNIVGFYVLAGRDLSGALYRSSRYQISPYEMEEHKKQFRKDNYKIITNSGYDEYYLLRHEGFSDDEDFEVDEDVSMRSLATAFVKYNMSRKTSRVILGRFIGMIA